jgi:hypothetical protein
MKHAHYAAQADIAEMTMIRLDPEGSREEMARPTQAPFRCRLHRLTAGITARPETAGRTRQTLWC